MGNKRVALAWKNSLEKWLEKIYTIFGKYPD
jgi:hypothetical protein